MSKHLVVIGDCRNMAEVEDSSVQLVVTSPPYFNVKDYGVDNIGSIQEYEVPTCGPCGRFSASATAFWKKAAIAA